MYLNLYSNGHPWLLLTILDSVQLQAMRTSRGQKNRRLKYYWLPQVKPLDVEMDETAQGTEAVRWQNLRGSLAPYPSSGEIVSG